MRYRKDNKFEHRNLIIFSYINSASLTSEERFFVNDIMKKLEQFAYKIQNEINDRQTLNLIITNLINLFCYTKSSSMNIKFKLIGEKPNRFRIECDDFGYTVNDYWNDIRFGSLPEKFIKPVEELQKVYPNVDFIHVRIYTIQIKKV